MSFAYENVGDIDREHWISSKPNSWKLEPSDDIVVDDQYEMEQNNYVDFQKIDDNSLNTESPIDNDFDFENLDCISVYLDKSRCTEVIISYQCQS